MSQIVKTFLKRVQERRRLYLDYTCWLETTEKLTDSQVTISPYDALSPVIVTTGYVDAAQKKLIMYASGGVANTNYTLSVLVRTDQGQTKVDDIGLKVNP